MKYADISQNTAPKSILNNNLFSAQSDMQYAVQQPHTPEINAGHTDTESSILEDPVSKLGTLRRKAQLSFLNHSYPLSTNYL